MSRKRVVGAAMAAALGLGGTALGVPFPVTGTIDLESEPELTLLGDADDIGTGFAVAPAGDVNGDQIPDVVVGASRADPFDRKDAGSAWVVFGSPGSTEKTLDLGKLGTRGFRINGAGAGDRAGFAVAGAGDFNGDGLDDVVVGAPRKDAAELEDVGGAYVVYGKKDTTEIDLSGLGGAGMRINGAGERDLTGVALANAGDLNADGRDDVIVGSPRVNVRDRIDAGVVSVIYGATGNEPVSIGDLGGRGWRIEGAAPGHAGISVASSADMNGDGRREIVIGAPLAGPVTPDHKGLGREAGIGYVIYGKSDNATTDLAESNEAGFALVGQSGENLGFRVAELGDVNGDGRPDVGFGAPRADRNEAVDSGSVHIMFGHGQGGTWQVATLGAGGARIDGATTGDQLGYALTAGADFNSDAKGDVAVAALKADPLSRQDAGAAYEIFGPVAAGENILLASLGERGIRFAGPVPGGEVAALASVGDMTGDKTADLAIGVVRGAKAADTKRAGSVHIVSAPVPVKPETLPPPDPGQQEEVQMDRCVAADNVEFVIDDSGSMSDTDRNRLRAQAMELIIAKPRNVGRVIGALEFGDSANPIFRPTKIDPPGAQSNQDALRKLIDDLVQADNGSTNYNAAFDVLGDENPAAKARIFLTDGEHNVGEFINGHRGGPPTFVLGLSIGRKGDAAARLRRIAEETKGSYFPNVKADTLQVVMNAIDSRLNCDIELDAFVDNLTAPDDVPANDVDIDDGTNSVDVNVSWDDAADEIDPDSIEVLDANGDRITKVGPRLLARTIRYSSRTRSKGALRLRGEEGRTFFSIRVSGVAGAKKLRVRLKATKVRRGARVHTQITQSRRRR